MMLAVPLPIRAHLRRARHIVVLSDVEPNTTVAGIPAIVVGKPSSEKPATDVDHTIEEV